MLKKYHGKFTHRIQNAYLGIFGLEIAFQEVKQPFLAQDLKKVKIIDVSHIFEWGSSLVYHRNVEKISFEVNSSYSRCLFGYFRSINSISGGKTVVFDHNPKKRAIIEISFWLMNQSTIPHKMLREYHPQLIDCLIQDAHLDILDWFFMGKNSLF